MPIVSVTTLYPNKGHILRGWGLGLQPTNLGGHNSAHHGPHNGNSVQQGRWLDLWGPPSRPHGTGGSSAGSSPCSWSLSHSHASIRSDTPDREPWAHRGESWELLPRGAEHGRCPGGAARPEGANVSLTGGRGVGAGLRKKQCVEFCSPRWAETSPF